MQNGQPADPTQGVGGSIAPNGNGVATFLLQNLGQGVYKLSAVYSGDVNYAPVTLSVATFYVINPSVQITVSGGTTTVTPGTPVQVTLTLMPLVGFSGNVSLECNSSDAPSQAGHNHPGNHVASVLRVHIRLRQPEYGHRGSGRERRGSVNHRNDHQYERSGQRRHDVFGRAAIALGAGWDVRSWSGWVNCRAQETLPFHGCDLRGVMMLSGLFMGLTACTNAGYSTPPPAPKVATPAGTYNVQIITYDPEALIQNSLTNPMFTLPVTVQ